MKKADIRIISFAAVLLLVAAAFGMAAEKSGAINLPKYEKFALDNGLTVYLMEMHEVPLIYVATVFDGGAVNDGDKGGLSFLTAQALMFGAGERTRGEIEELADFHGAQLNSGSDLETSSIASNFAAYDADVFLPLIRDMIVDPKFDAAEFEKRKAMLIMQLKQAKESPQNVIGGYYTKFLFGDHPYGNPELGTMESVGALTVDDVKAFYKDYYRPSNSAIAIVGDFKTDEMKAKITELLGGWTVEGEPKVNEALAKVDFPAIEKTQILLVNKDDAREMTFRFGSYGIKRSNPDYLPIQLINIVTGGRFTSWINTELRIKNGLTYGARTSWNTMRNAGSFQLFSYTQTVNAERALELSLGVMDRLHKEGFDDETLRSAKNYIKGSYPRQIESPGSLANLLTDMFTYGYDDSYVTGFSDVVESVTKEKVSELAATYFPNGVYKFVVVGKADELRDILAKYGDVTEIDINDDSFFNK